MAASTCARSFTSRLSCMGPSSSLHSTERLSFYPSKCFGRRTISRPQTYVRAESTDTGAPKESDKPKTAAQFVLEKAGISNTASSSGGSCCGGGCGGKEGDSKSVVQQLAELEASYTSGQMEGQVTREDIQAAYSSVDAPQNPGGPSEEKFLDIAAILQEAKSESGDFVFEDDLDEMMV